MIERSWFKCLSTSWNALAIILNNNPEREMTATYCRYSGKTVPRRLLSPKSDLRQSISKWESKFLICLIITYYGNNRFTVMKAIVIKLTLNISLPTIRPQIPLMGNQYFSLLELSIIPARSKFQGQTCRKEIILFNLISWVHALWTHGWTPSGRYMNIRFTFNQECCR